MIVGRSTAALVARCVVGWCGVLPWLAAHVVAACVFAIAIAPERASAQSTITPYFMVIVDNSGSMADSSGNGNNSCGQPRTRMNDARCVLQRVVNGYGEVRFGLERFTVVESGSCTSSCGATCGCQAGIFNCNNCNDNGGGCPSTGATADRGQILVPLAGENQSHILRWVDFSCGSGGCSLPTYPWALTGPGAVNPELSAQTWTPLAGSLRAARRYFVGNDPTYPGSPLAGDPAGTCRPVNVILLTDGEETCASDAQTQTAATELRSTVVGGLNYDIRTYVIGFGIAQPNPPGSVNDIENIAISGGTDAPGANRVYYATDEESLALAFSQIVESSIRYETCNGADDDCDTRVDEGFALFCARPAHPNRDLCADPGETACDGIDDNCNGVTDEGQLNACGVCGAVPTEVCNGVDDDCDTIIDEAVCGGCVPSAEICDGTDNDCDTSIDEGLSRSCGSDVGECQSGVQNCSLGSWGVCVGETGTQSEICDGLDNDCNGVIDGFTRACGDDTGACQAGTQVCVTAVWGTCTGAITPIPDVCNGVDDDCDGSIDEGNPGGGGTCGSTIGQCTQGTLNCVAGALTCTSGVLPTAEICDGLDQDCDGSIDESVPTAGSCGTDVGECSAGVLRCTGGSFQCTGGRGAAAETCNALDDDCDGSFDESNPGGGGICGSSIGVCSPGMLLCTGGTLTCVGGVNPSAERCDGADNDCDGTIDEAVPTDGACGSQTGECQRGVRTCVGGAYACVGATGPTAELCNGRDDDCDASTDEGNPGGGAICGIDAGECVTGALACVGGMLSCTGNVEPAAETCDGLDQDCDGTIDEAVATAGPCGSAVGECDPGVLTCRSGGYQCIGARAGSAEVCNGLDDDCDTRLDEGNPGGGASCGSTTGVCTEGTLSCQAGVLTCGGGVQPSAETCDRADNDCDGAIDEAVPPNGACGSSVGQCEQGALRCVEGQFECIGGRSPTDELCNALDDDCDTLTDEGNPGGSAACGSNVGQCSQGSSACVNGALTCQGGRDGVAETCNGLDDDCDGLIDEGNPDGGGQCGASNVGECEFGALACSNGVVICRGETMGRDEICDGRDNDCDGSVDEGNPEGGASCGIDTGECQPGLTRCVMGALVCDGSVGPTTELCNDLDDDCDGARDEGIPIGAPCGTDVGQCSPGVNVCRNGDLVCEEGVGPTDELCNALDDDCDGRIDEELQMGPECGNSMGQCQPGHIECSGGLEICVGEIPPRPEVCDCADNDCDGLVDETGDSLCPGGSSCFDCQCASPCGEDEFSDYVCSTGRVPRLEGGDCFCVAPTCDEAECATQTLTDSGGLVLCTPESERAGTCVCSNNECTPRCAGILCTNGLVCDPRAGTCVEDSCRGLGCETDEICDVSTGECTPDRCAAATCQSDRVCRDGTCEASCADIGPTCGAGERCARGECVADLCDDALCPDAEVCDSVTGSCVANRCIAVDCRSGEVCVGTTGACIPDPCVRVRCPSGQSCREGECGLDDPSEMDGGGLEMDAGTSAELEAGPRDHFTRVLAAGGGGLCALRSASPRSTRTLGAVSLLGALLGLLRSRRRALRRGSRAETSTRAVATASRALDVLGGNGNPPRSLRTPRAPGGSR